VPAHERNITEKAIILALAFRAGLAGREGDSFSVEPATLDSDLHRGFDFFIRRNNHWLRVDGTASRRFKGQKIARTVKFAKVKKRPWVYILRGDWQTAAFDVAGIGTAREKCFTASYLRVQDGRPLAFTEACPIHGNDCEFARRLFKFGSQLSRILASARRKDGSPSQAVEFAMEVTKPPF